MRIALFQPDIPQNAGTIMRLCACMGVPMDIIEPCGFILDEKKLRRAAMDYIDYLDLSRHRGWDDFVKNKPDGRIVLLTTKSDVPYTEFEFQKDDILLAGQESAGVPDHIHESADARITIPMRAEIRSLNVAVSCAMILGEALRQTDNFNAIQSVEQKGAA